MCPAFVQDPMVHRFDETKRRWVPGQVKVDNTRTGLRVASWNIWFADELQEDRSEALLKWLEPLGADVIALQEVTYPVLPAILGSSWVRERYVTSDSTGSTLGEYGTLLLTKRRVKRCWREQLPSRMGRTLLACDIEVEGRTVTVATTHLESLRMSHPTRREQIGLICDRLRAVSHPSIWVGDFNVSSEDLIDDLTGEFLDCWTALHPDDPGYTRDCTQNPLNTKKSQTKRERLDRMLVRSTSTLVSPASMRLLGTEPIDTIVGPIFASDHFGIVCDFVLG